MAVRGRFASKDFETTRKLVLADAEIQVKEEAGAKKGRIFPRDAAYPQKMSDIQMPTRSLGIQDKGERFWTFRTRASALMAHSPECEAVPERTSDQFGPVHEEGTSGAILEGLGIRTAHLEWRQKAANSAAEASGAPWFTVLGQPGTNVDPPDTEKDKAYSVAAFQNKEVYHTEHASRPSNKAFAGELMATCATSNPMVDMAGSYRGTMFQMEKPEAKAKHVKTTTWPESPRRHVRAA